jgi:hypothetical protein
MTKALAAKLVCHIRHSIRHSFELLKVACGAVEAEFYKDGLEV